jgi:hypothetical protein
MLLFGGFSSQLSKKYKTKTSSKLEDARCFIELQTGKNVPFCNLLLESIDAALLSLGKPVKSSIYFHLENSCSISKGEIPFRIEDFQNALEKIFGLGARHLEILFIKSLYEKLRTQYKWEMPRWVIPELTFKEYITIVKEDLEKLNPVDTKLKRSAKPLKRHL